MEEEPLHRRELAEDITKVIDNYGIEDFPEAKDWLTKSGLEAEKVKETLIRKIVEILS